MIEVSVVITSCNSEIDIQSCLESIKRQNLPLDQIEIIIVDNNSLDRTKEVSRKYTDKVYNFGPERSAQRNFGIGQAVGKYILFLDADMVLSETVILECVEECRRKDYVALYIPERVVGKGFWAKVRNFERGFYNATCIDCVRFMKREKFLEINGFDENLTGPEDWDFDRRINLIGQAAVIAAPIYHNEGKINFKKYLAKKSYYAQSFSRYIQKWGRNDPIIKKQFGLKYRFFGVFVENGKWKDLLKHPLLAVGMYLMRFLVGLTFIL